jgi:uncharacterized protein YdiU (UPF0061 family)
VVEASAALTAKWIAAGFVHGVLNTDNLNVTGESFDYGPWRFLPHYEPGFTAAYFDQNGLYAFARQPEAVFWNLHQPGGCFCLVSPPEPLVEALNRVAGSYWAELVGAMRRRLGGTQLRDGRRFLPRPGGVPGAGGRRRVGSHSERDRDTAWQPRGRPGRASL